MEFEKPNISPEAQEALDYIGMKKQECQVMGANDSEITQLEELRIKLKNNEIDPAEAKKLAYDIFESKQDYH